MNHGPPPNSCTNCRFNVPQIESFSAKVRDLFYSLLHWDWVASFQAKDLEVCFLINYTCPRVLIISMDHICIQIPCRWSFFCTSPPTKDFLLLLWCSLLSCRYTFSTRKLNFYPTTRVIFFFLLHFKFALHMFVQMSQLTLLLFLNTYFQIVDFKIMLYTFLLFPLAGTASLFLKNNIAY